MERWNSLPPMVRQVILGLGIFVVGAAGSFAYSYRPLHGALTFKVESLETRIDERNRENRELKDRLATLEKQESSKVDLETLSQVENELAQTQQALREAERKAERAEKKRRDVDAIAVRWRKRFETLRDQQASRPAVSDPAAAPSPTPDPNEAASGAPTGSAPQAPESLPTAPVPPVADDVAPLAAPSRSDAPAFP